MITTLDDTSTIKLDFTIPETLLSSVTAGLAIVARSVAYPEEDFAGKVASVDSRVDPTTRSVMVRALLPNERALLKPGMFLTVRLTRGASDALVVPEQALVPEQGDVFVYVVNGGRRRETAGAHRCAQGRRSADRGGARGGRAGRHRRHAEAARRCTGDGAENAARARVEHRGGGAFVRLSELSVRRPVLATVISLMLVILGLLAATRLPIRELPDVESPIVSIETEYLGASADVVETKITQVIEDRVAGLEGITKITSQSIDGRSSINLEFDARARRGRGGERRPRPRLARRRRPARRKRIRRRSARWTSTPSRSSS